MRSLVKSQWFASTDLLLVLTCGAVWMIKPEWGIWFFLIALLPWGARALAGGFPFRRTSLDLLIAIFLVTAWVGYWAAYDKPVAWSKLWFIMTSVLLYYALVAQPGENLFGISLLFFCMGVGVSIYYFLTQDFIAAPRKLEFVNQIGRWMMSLRPQTDWRPIHPNYAAGLIAVTVPFAFYPLLKFKDGTSTVRPLFYVLVSIGFGLAGLALVMATSRGVVFAIFSGAGSWLLWRLMNLDGIRHRFKSEAVFPILVFFYLCMVVAFLFWGPAQIGNTPSSTDYGNGSRGELFARSMDLFLDYPVTGGGLGSFPGLYSQYLLNIPTYHVPNSHNLFMDVAIEQGIFGGASFILMYMAGIWFVSRSSMHGMTPDVRLFSLIALFVLIVAFVHGMVDDYLYNGIGAMLSLFIVGMSMNRDDQDFYGMALDFRLVGIAVIALSIVMVANLDRFRSTWYANLGAVQMARVELAGFPTNTWTESSILPELESAETSLRSALQFDPVNRTANHRLGLLAMLRTDFDSARAYLEIARSQDPDHRGIIKALGYCYVWLGKMEEAQILLAQIPEARDELDVYVWWWGAQGNGKLSENALKAVEYLDVESNDP